jgi:hypothetical protein
MLRQMKPAAALTDPDLFHPADFAMLPRSVPPDGFGELCYNMFTVNCNTNFCKRLILSSGCKLDKIISEILRNILDSTEQRSAN